MILTLDGSVVIDLMRGRRQEVRERFLKAQAAGAEFKLSAIALHELATGARKSDRPDAKLEEVDEFLNDVELVDFDAGDAMMAGAVRADLEAHPSHPIDAADLLIGAQALNRGWTLVTSNTRHFGRISGLRMIDWRRSSEPFSMQDIIARLTGRNEDE